MAVVTYSINIFILAAILRTGNCIKCYNCDSSEDSKCGTSTGQGLDLKAEECVVDKIYGLKSLTKVVQDLNMHILGSSVATPFDLPKDAPLNCLKLVKSDGVVIRGCQVAPINKASDYCDKVFQHTQENFIRSCSMCAEDECNGALQNSITRLIYLLPLLLSLWFWIK